MTKAELYAALVADERYIGVQPVAEWVAMGAVEFDRQRYDFKMYTIPGGIRTWTVYVLYDGGVGGTETIEFTGADPTVQPSTDPSFLQLVREEIDAKVTDGTIKAGFVIRDTHNRALVEGYRGSDGQKINAIIKDNGDGTVSFEVI